MGARNLEGYADGYEDGLKDGKADADDAWRADAERNEARIEARIRRDEVEPLREALRRLVEHLDTSDGAWVPDCCIGCGSRTFEHRPRCTYEAAEAALRAADERGR